MSLSNGGEASAESLRVAANVGSVGEVNIGAAAGEIATGAGALNTPALVFGAGMGKLVFNQPAYALRVSCARVTFQHTIGRAIRS